MKDNQGSVHLVWLQIGMDMLDGDNATDMIVVHRPNGDMRDNILLVRPRSCKLLHDASFIECSVHVSRVGCHGITQGTKEKAHCLVRVGGGRRNGIVTVKNPMKRKTVRMTYFLNDFKPILHCKRR